MSLFANEQQDDIDKISALDEADLQQQEGKDDSKPLSYLLGFQDEPDIAVLEENQHQHVEEEDDDDEDDIEVILRNKPNASSRDERDIGIALAGGSLRAASAGMAILRGFAQKKATVWTNGRIKKTVPAMDKVRYNSGCSGGAIPAVLFSYAQVPTDELLDTKRTTNPTKITKQKLDYMPKTSILESVTKVNVGKAALFFCTNWSKFCRTHGIVTSAIYEMFLKQYHVPRNMYFTSGEDELERIIESRIDPSIRRDDFLLPRNDIKTLPMIVTTFRGCRFDFFDSYLKKWNKITSEVWDRYESQVLNSSISSTSNNKKSAMTKIVLKAREAVGDGNVVIPFVVTPDVVETNYSGKVLLNRRVVKFPLEPIVPFKWGERPGRQGRKRFSVEMMMTLSANSTAMREMPFISSSLSNTRNIKLDENGRCGMQLFADGGMNDVTGILPLLMQEEIKDIIFVYNFNKNKPYSDLTTTYADIYRASNGITKYTGKNFKRDYKEWLKMMSLKFTCLWGYFGEKKGGREIFLNHVFHDPRQNRLKELMVKLNALFEAGEPLVAKLEDLELIDNPFWGLKEGRKVNLTVIFYNMPKRFSEKVPSQAVPPPRGMPKIDKDGRFNNEEFRCIPELETQTKAYTYSNAQMNMMGYLGSWIIDRSWDGLKSSDGQVVFDGFRNMFEKKK